MTVVGLGGAATLGFVLTASSAAPPLLFAPALAFGLVWLFTR